MVTYLRKDHPVLTPPPAGRPAPGRAGRGQYRARPQRCGFCAHLALRRCDDAELAADSRSLDARRNEGQAVAFALTTCSAGDGYAQLIRIGTHPQWQNQGIGRQLVVDAINFGHDSGAAGVALNTQLSNDFRHLYEALGFHMVGPALNLFLYHIA